MKQESKITRLTDDVIDYLRRAGNETSYSSGEAILTRGEAGKHLFVILEGNVKVYLTGGEGKRLLLRTLPEGTFFGEMSVLTGEPVSADIEADTDVRLLAYPGALLPKAMSESEPLRDLITKSLASNVRNITSDVWNFFQRAETLNLLLDSNLRPGELVAESKPMRKVADEIARQANELAPLLISGAPGVGKYYTALKIHEGKENHQGRLIAVNCRTLPAGESVKILFGAHLSGGAEVRQSSNNPLQHYGAIHLANQGTLILRHLESLDPEAQQELSNYLEGWAAGRIAYPQARIIATLSGESSEQTRAGHFHDRLASLFTKNTIKIPTLRERRKDILPLAHIYLLDAQKDRELKIGEAAQNVLLSRKYNYRNCDELREAIQLAALFAQDGEIQAEHIFTGPKDEGSTLEFDLAQLPLINRFLHSDKALRTVRLGIFLFFSTMIAGTLLLPSSTLGKLMNFMVWGVWEPALIVVFLILGRVWCTVCPLSSASRFVSGFIKRDAAPPEWMKKVSPWAISFGLMLIFWYEHVLDTFSNPLPTGFMLLGLMLLAVTFGVLFKREVWCRYLCPMGSLGAVHSPFAMLGIRSNPNVCGTLCTTHECHNGSSTHPGCPVFHHPLFARDSHLCKLCFNCLKSCTHGSAKLYLRPPLMRVWQQGEMGGSLVNFALLIFACSLVFLATQIPDWRLTVPGYTAAVLGAMLFAVLAGKYLPRLLSRDPDENPSLAPRVVLAILALGWGAEMAYQLGNSEVFLTLSIRALPGTFWEQLLPFAELPMLTVLQLGFVVLSALIAAIVLFNIRHKAVTEKIPLRPYGWNLLFLLCALYFIAVTGFVTIRVLHL
jgi:transcriptional regulator with AAA-type ATPase domain